MRVINVVYIGLLILSILFAIGFVMTFVFWYLVVSIFFAIIIWIINGILALRYQPSIVVQEAVDNRSIIRKRTIQDRLNAI